MKEYPKYLYGAEGSKLVRNADEESALIGTWCDSPEKVPTLKPEHAKEEEKQFDDIAELTCAQDEVADSAKPSVQVVDPVRPKLGRPFKAK